MKKMRIGIIGCGNIFHIHAAAINEIPNVCLTAVCDICEDRANSAASKYSAIAYYDYKDMIINGELDCVHICLPHHLHCEATIFAMQHGLDVICEKPICINRDQLELMLETKRQTKKKLGIVFQNRFNPGSLFLKEAIESGRLGKILSVESAVKWFRGQDYYDGAKWRGYWNTEGGGVLINQAIHTLDLMRYLINSQAVSVDSELGHLGETTVEVEDTAKGKINFANGVVASFNFTINACDNFPVNILITCEKATLSITGEYSEIAYHNGIVECSNTPYLKTEIEGFKNYWGTGHTLQITDFYLDSSGSSTDWQLQEAVDTQRLVFEIYETARQISPLKYEKPSQKI